MGSRWALRVHAACDWVVWAACLNALWLAGVLAGAVVLGIGPATAAAAALTRRRLRGENVRFVPDYASAWARGLLASQVAVGLPLLAAALIAVQASGRLAAHPDAWAALLSVAAAFTFAVATVSLAMHVHYDLRPLSDVVIASRWVLRNPGPALLLIATATALVAATAALPALALVLTGGAWITIATALCLGFFAANEAALAATNEGVHS